MKLYIGENLKKLRKLRELTQEQLAQILGVSFQSVSKWERNEGYPDIELLPVIANYFGITVDELMGMDAIRDDSDVEKILDKVRENASKGMIEENIALLESAAKRFPKNYAILEEYADSLTFVNWDRSGEPYRQNCLKAIAISERILAECTDEAIRDTTQTNLCYYYQRTGQHEKALEAVRKLPNLWETYEIVGENILEDEELLDLQQSNILSLTELLYMTLTLMSREENPAYTPEEKIKIKQKVVALYDLIFEEGDFNFYAHNLSYVYRQIAMTAMSEGDHALALESLEKSADYAVENDALPDEKPYTSLVVNRMRHNTKNTITNLKTSYSEEMLQHLALEKYDAIRGEPRFRAIEKRLNEFRHS